MYFPKRVPGIETLSFLLCFPISLPTSYLWCALVVFQLINDKTFSRFFLKLTLGQIWFSSYLLWALFNSDPGYTMTVNSCLGLGGIVVVDFALSLL